MSVQYTLIRTLAGFTEDLREMNNVEDCFCDKDVKEVVDNI